VFRVLTVSLLLWSAAAGRAAPAAPSFTVVLDPGHGGEKDGAVGTSGLREKDLTLQIARRTAALVRRRGGRVVLTRSADLAVPLARRAAIANAERADLFVSIHLNAMPGEARRVTHGLETYFLSADATDASAHAVAARENADRLAGEPELDRADPVSGILEDLANTNVLAESSDLAYALHDALVAGTGAADRGVKQAPFYVLAGARVPAVLVEIGFLSHPSESRRLATADYQDRVARAIADAIEAWRARSATGGETSRPCRHEPAVARISTSAPSASSRASRSTRRGPASRASETPTSCAPRRWRTASRRTSSGPAPGG
jgi:N-acetylmuramoyl-L-alanine amidase